MGNVRRQAAPLVTALQKRPVAGLSLNLSHRKPWSGTSNALSPSRPLPPPGATIAPPAAEVKRRREGEARGGRQSGAVLPDKKAEQWTRFIRTLEGHEDAVHACAVSRNGDTAISVSEDGTVRRDLLRDDWPRNRRDGAELAGPDPFRLPNGQLIGPGCVRSPGTDVPPKQSGGVRVSASLASGHLTDIERAFLRWAADPLCLRRPLRRARPAQAHRRSHRQAVYAAQARTSRQPEPLARAEPRVSPPATSRDSRDTGARKLASPPSASGW